MNLYYNKGCLYADGVLVKGEYAITDADIMEYVKKVNLILYKPSERNTVSCLFMRNTSLIEKYQKCLLRVTETITEFCVSTGFSALMFSFNEFFEHSLKIEHSTCSMNMGIIAHMIPRESDFCSKLAIYLEAYDDFTANYITFEGDGNYGIFYFEMDGFSFILKCVGISDNDYNISYQALTTFNQNEYLSLYWKYIKPSLKVKDTPWHRCIIRHYFPSKRSFIDYNATLLALSMEQNKCSLGAKSFYRKMYDDDISISEILASIIKTKTA